MDLPLYLAMTAQEIASADFLPQRCAYMACHFSLYSAGLSNFPQSLPEGSILILNDRIPIQGHDASLITKQLSYCVKQLQCCAVLLDFQRPNEAQTEAVTKQILAEMPCPVCVSHHYARSFDCPVFLPSAPLDSVLSEYIEPWKNRAIWLEAAPGEQILTLTSDGCTRSVLYPETEASYPFTEPKLHCHYKISKTAEKIEFYLQRTKDELRCLLDEAKNLGVVQAVGLYQQLCSFRQKDDCAKNDTVIN